MESGDNENPRPEDNQPVIFRIVQSENEEGRTVSIPSSSRIQTSRILRYFLSRFHVSPNEDAEELSSLERRLRRRRHTFLDEDNVESEEELTNPVVDEDYLDFRTYPLNINWTEIYSTDNDSYEILEEYGYIAVYVYNSIISKFPHFKAKPETFLSKIVEYYTKNFESEESEKAIENQTLIVTCFPNLRVLKNLIYSQLVVKKEIGLVKVILDLTGHYYQNYEKFNSSVIINEYLPTSLLFYSILPEEDIKEMTRKLQGMKDLTESLKNNLQILVTDNKRKYLKYLLALKSNYYALFKDVELDKFTI